MENCLCRSICEVRLPDTLVLKIFFYLNRLDIMAVSNVCRQWWRVSKDDSFWKRRFLLDFNLDPTQTSLGNVAISWNDEYRRIRDETPRFLAQTINAHNDEVLHVAFSHDGTMFSTCSKDCTVKVWTSGHPCQLIFDVDLKLKYNWWEFTQISQFSPDDRLLLISGVQAGQNQVGGDIAIFEITADRLSSRGYASNKPYDVFGCWFDARTFLSGELQFEITYTSSSTLRLCKFTGNEGEQNLAVSNLFKFLNVKASVIRTVAISGYVSDNVRQAIEIASEMESGQSEGLYEFRNFKIAMEHLIVENNYKSKSNNTPTSSNCEIKSSSCISKSNKSSSDRLLIFTTGNETFTPHQIGFKLVKQEMFNDDTMSERQKKIKKGRSDPNGEGFVDSKFPKDVESKFPKDFDENKLDREYLKAHNFDVLDYAIDLRGHIVGMSLSSDEKHLFVNVRSWPEGAVISNTWNPPPISDMIELRVIDMETLSVLPKVYQGHRGFTRTDSCFLMFTDACESYVASGSEDKFAYVWDRHFDLPFVQLPHDGVVNSVAFNPKSHQMLVSTSDDRTIKIWRSKKMGRDLNIN